MGHIDDNVYLGFHLSGGAIKIELRHHHGARNIDRVAVLPAANWLPRLREAARRGRLLSRLRQMDPDFAAHLADLPDCEERLADIAALLDAFPA